MKFRVGEINRGEIWEIQTSEYQQGILNFSNY